MERAESGSRSDEHTSALQSHSEISYAVFCLKKKNEISPHRRGFQSTRRPPEADTAPNSPSPFFFFFNDTATTEIYTNLNTLSLHDALPISRRLPRPSRASLYADGT